MEEVKGNKSLQKAKELLEDISEDEYEQDLAFKRHLYQMDKVAIEAAGYDKGKEEGIQQGIQQGRQEGIQQGTAMEKLEIARNMLKQNISIEIIMQCTGLTEREIKEIE